MFRHRFLTPLHYAVWVLSFQVRGASTQVLKCWWTQWKRGACFLPVFQVKLFLLQNVGIGMGVALLFLMAKYSEKINFEYFSSLPPGVSVAAASFGGAHDDARAVFGGLGMWAAGTTWTVPRHNTVQLGKKGNREVTKMCKFPAWLTMYKPARQQFSSSAVSLFGEPTSYLDIN